MKYCKLIIITIGFVIISSCASPLSSRLNDYVNKVEFNCQNWTEKDWELSQEEYLKLIEEYELNYESYTQEEKDAINRAIGRYNGLLIKQGIEEAGSVIQELGERLPSLIEGFMSAFETDDNKR
jgi:hypothetical protein